MPADIAAVRGLCWAYRDFLMSVDGISAEVQDAFHPAAKYETLLDSLPSLHARPKGIILIACDGTGQPVGCGMSHPLDDQTSEIKRVYVTDSARRKGVATRLCNTLIAQAQDDGFARVVLDTHKLLLTAQRLYERLGFTSRGAYQPMPENVLPELMFFERYLTLERQSK